MTRLAAHLEVSGLIRQVNSAGGFAAVLHKGEREAGTILVVLRENGLNLRAFERMPNASGAREWAVCKVQVQDNKEEFQLYLDRRKTQDSDLWIVELDIPNGERFIVETGTLG